MASKKPAADDAPPASSEGGPSTMQLIIAIAILTVLGIGAGAALGLKVASTMSPPPLETVAKAEDAKKTASSYGGDIEVRELPAIVTNLASPADARVRLQASIVFDKKAVSNANILAAEIGGDVLTFMRSSTLAQFQGASGLLHLREDLSERAAIRSNGEVKEFIIEALVVQ
jgi:flagellar FliL protein